MLENLAEKQQMQKSIQAERRKRSFLRAAALMLCLFLLCAFIAGSAAVTRGDAEKPEGATDENTQTIVELISKEEGYSAILYDNTNGLPTSEANDIAETDDGFIWIGSYSGLVRYDGHNFERLDSTSGITSVKCLFVDSRDRLWIGTNDRGVALMENGTFRIWGNNDGLGASSVRGIVEDPQGIIYVATTGGISMITPDMRIISMRDPAIAGAFINALVASEEGVIYGLTNAGDVFTIKDAKMDSFISHEEFGADGVNCIYPDPERPGYVYIETMDSSLCYGRLENSFQEMKKIDIAPLSQIQSLKYIDGKIWICTRTGIGALDSDGFHYLDKLPLDNSVSRVISDYEGNLWFTSTRQGVMKVTKNRFVDIFDRYDLQEEVVNSTCLYNGMLYLATDGGLIVLDENGVVSSVPLTSAVTASGEDLGETDLVAMLDGCRIRSAIRDSKGNLWLSTWRKFGLVRLSGSEVTAFTAADGMLSDHVRAVYEREDGSIIAAVTGGVNVIEGDRVTAFYNEKDGFVNTEILTVTEGLRGEIVCGTDGGGIYIINGKLITHIDTNGGLTSDAVMRIKKDSGRGIYWIVTGNSIAYMTENYQVNTIDTFPYSNNFDLYENSRGEVWILSSNGVYIAAADDLIANDNIEPMHYAISDGLPCIATANSYSELTDSGELYIAGTTGVAKVNIDEPYESIGDLKAAIPYIDADGRRLYPDASGGFTVSPGVRKLTIYGFVYNYSLVNPQVSYRLKGFESDYTTLSRSDLGPVDYTNLKGGSYEFEMLLREPVSRKYRTVSVRITKEKAFFEQIWFIISAGFLVLTGIVLGVRLYVRRKTRQLEEKHREETEKQRMLSELTMANRIQIASLPGDFPAFPDRTEFDIYAVMNPALEVGGDFYDFFLIDDDHLGLVMADVSGKGIPAALFMMNSKSIVKNCAMLGRSPAEILTKTNEAICASNKMEMFVTVWVAILEISTGILTAANAGHEYPAIRKAGGDFELYKDRHGFVIGGMEGVVYKEYTMTLSPGDKLFVYTDGVPEAADNENQLYGTQRMIEALNKDPEAAPEAVLNNVLQSVREFVHGAEQFDDLTMLCVEYKGKKQNQ